MVIIATLVEYTKEAFAHFFLLNRLIGFLFLSFLLDLLNLLVLVYTKCMLGTVAGFHAFDYRGNYLATEMRSLATKRCLSIEGIRTSPHAVNSHDLAPSTALVFSLSWS